MKIFTVIMLVSQSALISSAYGATCTNLSWQEEIVKESPQDPREFENHEIIDCNEVKITYVDIAGKETRPKQRSTIKIDGKWHEKKNDDDGFGHKEKSRTRWMWTENGTVLTMEGETEGRTYKNKPVWTTYKADYRLDEDEDIHYQSTYQLFHVDEKNRRYLDTMNGRSEYFTRIEK